MASFIAIVTFALLALTGSACADSGRCVCTIVQWVPGNGTVVPNKAVKVDDDLPGTSGGPVYVGRASYGGALLPGKYVRDEGVLKATAAGKEITFREFEVLTLATNYYPRWTSGNVTSWPNLAIEGGHEACGPLFICKGEYFRYFVPGKLNPGLRTCSIGVLGTELVLEKYDMLIYY